jgi:indolepyruvate ferredoxin oxidoreductase beta subunit
MCTYRSESLCRELLWHLPAIMSAPCDWRVGRKRDSERTMKNLGLLVTGVGGQGIVLASDITGEAAMSEGFDVKKTDTLGMAQRGGSVVSHIRIAKKVYSPLIPEGEVDLLLAFEKLEAARWSNHLRSNATVVINQYAQPPLAVNLGNEKYPGDDDITGMLRQRTNNIYYVEGTERVRQIGDVRTLNMYMLGCASCFLPIKVQVWKETITQRVPARFRAMNIAAFESGRREIRDVNRR